MPETEKIITSSSQLLMPEWADEMNQLGTSRTPFFFILDFDGQTELVVPLKELDQYGIQFEFPEYQHTAPLEFIYPQVSLAKHPVSFEQYKIGFSEVMKAIHAGDTYLLNLSFVTPVEGLSSLHQVFYIASARYKIYCPQRFVCFSPEQFVSIQNSVIRTFPMKGTIDAAIPNAEQQLLDDLKEQEEHATVVDLLRNDLSIVANQVTVERYRFISKIINSKTTLLQTSSEITGRLPADYLDQLGTIFHALLPAGSVTGAPKKKTVELIRSIEMESRGFYTGVCGVFDGEKVDSAVMIRMIEQRGDQFYYRSGGGITYRSDAASEYQEMIDKVYVPFS